jgi:O-antigen/teichoic acid export membrane protein
MSIGGIILYPDSIIGPIYGRLLSGVLIFLIAHFIFMKNGKFIIDQSFLPDLAQFCTPYIFYAISGWVLGQIDRYILQTYISKADLNTYDLALKCFFGIEFIQNSLSAIIFPKLYEIWNKQDVPHTTPESNRYFNAFTAINIMQLIVFCLALPIVYKLLITNKSFYDSSRYIGMIAAGYGMRSLVNFYLATILFRKKPYILLKIFGISAVIQLVITYFAIGTFGLTGAIYAGLITKILQAVLSVIFTRGIFEYRFNQSKLILIPAVYIIINIIQFHLTGSYNVYLYLSQLLLFSTIFFLVFKNELGIVWKQLLSKT